MCLINFAFHVHPEYPLILVGTRDEFYLRPTEELHWWKDHPDILAGRDLQAGGTWMGMSRDGKVAALTNYRDLRNIKTDAPTRGLLINYYLSGEIPLEEFHNFLKTEGPSYNGFNIIYGTPDDLYYYGNADGRSQHLKPGIYGLSNAFLDTPWRKLVRSKKAFTKMLTTELPPADNFIDMMHDTDESDTAELPSTGVPPELEKKLSAMFVEAGNYGSRLTTFISVQNNGEVKYHEKSYIPPHEIKISFQIRKQK